jgi:hypothetical protein
MTNHPNRGWRGRWEFVGHDLRHKPTGLVVRFVRAADDPSAWDGDAVNVEQVSAFLVKSESIELVAKKLSRLMRETGELFQESNHE